jgi:hypothetical protein
LVLEEGKMALTNKEVMDLAGKLDLDLVMDAVERQNTGLDNPGFCLGCGEEADGCEPDARGYDCEFCGEPLVYGAADILMYMV